MVCSSVPGSISFVNSRAERQKAFTGGNGGNRDGFFISLLSVCSCLKFFYVRIIIESIDPALVLDPLLERIGNFLGGLPGPALHLAAAAFLAIHMHPAADDESRRILRSQETGHAHRRPRFLAAGGIDGGGSHFTQSIRRHLEAFDRRSQFGGALAKA